MTTDSKIVLLFFIGFIYPVFILGANLGFELIDRANVSDKVPFTISMKYGLGAPGVYDSVEFFARETGEIVISVLGEVTNEGAKISAIPILQKTVQAIPGENKVALNWSVGADDLIALSWTEAAIIPYDDSEDRNFFVKKILPVLGEPLKLAKQSISTRRKYSFRVTYTAEGLSELTLGFPASSRNEYVTETNVTYLLDEEITLKGTLKTIQYFGKKNKPTEFWLFRPAGGDTYTPVEKSKNRADITGVNTIYPEWDVLPGDKMGFFGVNLEVAYAIEDEAPRPFNYLKTNVRPEANVDLTFDQQSLENQIFSLNAQYIAAPETASASITQVSQSSTRPAGGAAERAVDGDKNPSWRGGSCSHTDTESNPWWKQDFPSSQQVTRVFLTNRDRLQDRLSPLDVYVISDGEEKLCTSFSGPAGHDLELTCSEPIVGEGIKIQLPGDGRILTLCEVVVNAPYVYQSSIWRTGGAAERAVDGNKTPTWRGKSCSHTDTESNPWWIQYFDKTSIINGVTLTNRDTLQERLSPVDVYVIADGEEKPCASFTGTPGDVLDLPCDSPVTGEAIKIQLPGEERILTLCEVEIY